MEAKDIKLKKSVLIELKLEADRLTKKDIATWRNAWQMAINPENPKRMPLYNIYADVLMDLHLTGAIGQRKSMVQQRKYKIVDKTGMENEQLSESLKTEWFKDFIDLALDSIYYGHSLIQFGDVINVGGVMKYDGVELVPRSHVIPEYGVITKDAGDDWQRGISYRKGNISNWCIEIGKPKNIGLLLKLAPHAISKKNMLAYWDVFGEVFGMPIRIGKTNSRDQKDQDRIEGFLKNMGALSYGLFPEGTAVEVVETTRGDAFNVYDKRVERCNSELSKGVLNQTMTIDQGSSYSQSEVHLEVFKNVIKKDEEMIKDVINDKLLPLMRIHGFPFENHTFEWNDSIDYTPEQQLSIEQMLLNNFEADENVIKFFADKYGVPVSKPKSQPLFPQEQMRNFFA